MPRKTKAQKAAEEAAKHGHMTCIERIDVAKLKYILDNYQTYLKGDELRLRPERHADGSDTSPQVLCSRYLAKCDPDSGELIVQYIQKNSKGRMQAVRSISLQNMQRQIRHTVAAQYYYDLDMENCHPTLLSQMLSKERRAPASPELDYYVANTEKCRLRIQDVGLSRDKAKRVYLSLINGGCAAYKEVSRDLRASDKKDAKEIIASLTRFKKELQSIHAFYAEEPEFEQFKIVCHAKKKVRNLKASYMNTLLCDAEHRCLMAMYNSTFINSPEDCVLCFDGIMLLKADFPSGFSKGDIQSIQEDVYRDAGFRIKLVVKPMKEALKLPKDWKTRPKKEYFYHDYKKYLQAHPCLDISEARDYVVSNIASITNDGKRQLAVRCLTQEYVGGYCEERLKWTLQNPCDACSTLFVDCDIIDRTMNNPPVDKNGNEKPLFNIMAKFVEHCSRKMWLDVYASSQYTPYLDLPPKQEMNLNTFGGFPLYRKLKQRLCSDSPLPDYKSSLMYKHLTQHFFLNIEEYRHWECQMADMIQLPAIRRSNNSRLFVSDQGCGKELLFKFASLMFGHDNTVKIHKAKSYFEDDFNADSCSKLLKCFEELSGGSSSAAWKHSNLLKCLTEATKERVNGKNCAIYWQRVYAIFWFFSNNKTKALYLEPGDRRYTVHLLKNDKADMDSHFKPLWKELENVNMMMSWFQHFATMEYHISEVMNSLRTEAKSNMISKCFPQPVAFIISQFEKGWPEEYIDPDTKVIRIPTKVFSEISNRYCMDEDARYKRAVLYSTIQMKLGIEKKQRRFGTKTAMSVEFSRVSIQARLRKMLKNDKYMLPEKCSQHIDEDGDDQYEYQS